MYRTIGRIGDIGKIGNIETILLENEKRREEMFAPFDPITGERSVGERREFRLKGCPIERQWLPVEMMSEPLVQRLGESGSVVKFIRTELKLEVTVEAVEMVLGEFYKLRTKYDFAFWAATMAFIKNKYGGQDVLFRLSRPQRRLVGRLERMRKAGKPIRLILLKARQWGGSTCIQLYMAWLQLRIEEGLNSLIIAHQGTASDEIKDMFDRMIRAYPIEMLHEAGDVYSENEPKLVGVGKSGNIFRVPQRNSKIKIGTAERPNSCRGGAYNLVHLSEVGLWPDTEKITPQALVRSATTGILLRPNTMIVYESTPNGVGNFFHKEYLAAKKGDSQFEALFISWFDIELYLLPFGSDEERDAFAEWLYANRESSEVKSEREEPGNYLWYLWTLGASLEGIHWYVEERTKFTDHGDMASEYPSDDIEAFTFSGRRVFAKSDIEKLRPACRPPRKRGEIVGRGNEGEAALENVRFVADERGQLCVWHDVEKDSATEEVADRYLVVVDVCKGHTKNADFADILVLDRLPMMDGEGPVVAAEWHGHIEMDRLAWKAAQVAEYYNHALLVIESNTLETNNTKGEAEYILTLIHDVYGDQLYARKQSAEDIKEQRPKRYGYHTNVVTKKVVVYNMQVAVRERLYVEHEAAMLDELDTYMETEDGVFEAKAGYHDDRLMTRAIGLQISTHEMDLPRVVKRGDVQRMMSKQVVSAATIG